MCMFVHLCKYMCGGPQGPEEGVGYPRKGVTGNCEPPSMSTRNKTGPLEDQQVLLTAELSLQLHPSLHF